MTDESSVKERIREHLGRMCPDVSRGDATKALNHRFSKDQMELAEYFEAHPQPTSLGDPVHLAAHHIAAHHGWDVDEEHAPVDHPAPAVGYGEPEPNEAL